MKKPNGRSVKAKGREFQNKVRDDLVGAFPSIPAGDIKSTTMGDQGVDIQLSDEARKQLPFAIETKRLAKIGIYGHFEQAIRNTPEGDQPLLIVKGDYKQPLVVLDWQYFLELIKE
jgi:hypothetical protein